MKIIPTKARIVVIESWANLNTSANGLIEIITRERAIHPAIPRASGVEKAGDLKIEREERMDKTKANSAKTEKINQPV